MRPLACGSRHAGAATVPPTYAPPHPTHPPTDPHARARAHREPLPRPTGLYSLIKRSPKAKIKRKTFEVPGPAAQGAVPLDERARRIFGYFQRYNYTLKGTGDVIVFEGNYKASAGQAAALVFYTAVGLACTALVLSITLPEVGGWWYMLCAVSPAAGWYYYKNADRCVDGRRQRVAAAVCVAEEWVAATPHARW